MEKEKKLNKDNDNDLNIKNKNNSSKEKNYDFNNKIIHYKEFLLNLEKEFSNNNDKLKKISSLKEQINEISKDLKSLNSLEEQQGINDKQNYSSQIKSINNLSLIVNTLEKNYLKKQKINDKIISKMSRKIKDILIYNKEINYMKNEIEKDKEGKIKFEKKINEIENTIPNFKTELNMNKHKYSKLLEENEKIKKDNFIINEKMYNEIIDNGNKIKILEERKERLIKVKNEQIDNLNKKEKIKEMEKILDKLKKEKEIIEEDNAEYEKIINDFMTHLNLNYINLINLRDQFETLNQNEIKIQDYILNKKEQCEIVEKQMENILNKYY